MLSTFSKSHFSQFFTLFAYIYSRVCALQCGSSLKQAMWHLTKVSSLIQSKIFWMNVTKVHAAEMSVTCRKAYPVIPILQGVFLFVDSSNSDPFWLNRKKHHQPVITLDAVWLTGALWEVQCKSSAAQTQQNTFEHKRCWQTQHNRIGLLLSGKMTPPPPPVALPTKGRNWFEPFRSSEVRWLLWQPASLALGLGLSVILKWCLF